MIQTLTEVNDKTLSELNEELKIRKTTEFFLLFSLGSQFDHLIKQAWEKLGVFCLVADPKRITAKDVKKLKPLGIILSGGPVSVYKDPPPFDSKIFDLNIPVLGICLGFQLWAKHIDCEIKRADKKEYGRHLLTINVGNKLLAGCNSTINVLESHGDSVIANPNLIVLATTVNAPVAAANYKHLWGVQFHPEVSATEYGLHIFKNFCFEICGAQDVFPAQQVAQQKIQGLKAKIGQDKVLMLTSGGSDSSVIAHLLKAVGADNPNQLLGLYIKGIDRPDDEQHVIEFFGNQPWMKLKIVDATDKFLLALKDKTTMPEKRLAMRAVYKEVAETEAANFGAKFIAQGTLYTDISESGFGYNIGSKKARIKLHHNVNLGFNLPEITPLDDCVKDNARNIGRSIGVPEALLTRHPFPGPGLVVRILGRVTRKKLKISRQSDDIFIAELRKHNLYETVWQAGAVLLNSVTTGTKGDSNALGLIVSLWAYYSVNGFTAEWAKLPADFLELVSQRLTNEISDVGRVVYNISNKPPATIEFG